MEALNSLNDFVMSVPAPLVLAVVVGMSGMFIATKKLWQNL